MPKILAYLTPYFLSAFYVVLLQIVTPACGKADNSNGYPKVDEAASGSSANNQDNCFLK